MTPTSSPQLRRFLRRTRRAARRARPALALALCLAVGTLAACHDTVTPPRPESPLSAGPLARFGGFTNDADFGSLNSPNSGTYDGTISTWDGGAAPQPIGSFHFPTIGTVNISGSVTQVPGLLAGDQLTWGPAGTNDHQAAIGLTNGAGFWFPDGLGPATVKLVGDVSAFRTPLNDPQPYGLPHWTCGRHFPDRDHPCWSFQGSAHLDFTRIPVGMTVTSSAGDRSVEAGTMVTFTVTKERDEIGGRVVDMSQLKWRWIPEAANSADTCASSSGASCTRVIMEAGTMLASAYVNGEQQVQSVEVKMLPPPTLILTASKETVLAPGEMDTFVPSASDGSAIVVHGWSFTPDGPTGGITTHGPLPIDPDEFRTPPLGPATIGARAAVTPSSAAPAHPSKGRGVSSQMTTATRQIGVPTGAVRSVSAGSAWGGCGPGTDPCTNLVTTSGMVEVLATVHGLPLTARVHVTVIPCPTGNPVLDDPKIRSDLKALLNKSGPNLQPGSGLFNGSSVGNKREHAGNIFRRPDGTYYFVEDALAVGNECHTARIPMATPQSPADSLVGIVHTHPTKTGQIVYGCSPDPISGDTYQRYPGDPSTTYVAQKAADSSSGGGSIADWNSLTAHPGNNGSNALTPHVDGYVINADGEVWLLSALDAFRFADQKNNRNMWRHDGNTNQSCTW